MAVSHVSFTAPDESSGRDALRERRGAQFLLAQFASPSVRQAVEWVEATREVAQSIGVAEPAPLERDVIVAGWRLVADNSRELARSFGLKPGEWEARRDAQRLRANVTKLRMHVVVTPQLRGAGWCGTIDGQPVVIGARRYENKSAARAAADLMLRLLAPVAREPKAADLTPE